MLVSRRIVGMPTNAGGVIDPDELVGRERELQAALDAVEIGGAKLLGDRRMGKTSLLGALTARLRADGHHVVRVSAETSNPTQFGQRLLAALGEERLLARTMPRWHAELGGSLGVNVGVASLSLTGTVGADGDGTPSRDLFAACSEAATGAGTGRRVVFVLDEITALARAMGDGAEGLFQSLRAPRQSFDNISVVIAGSIGLHHVLRDMAAVNDIPAVTVGPLVGDDAVYLARCLLRGAEVAVANERDVAETIAVECSAVPFYIHKLVETLVSRGMHAPMPADISSLVEGIVSDPDDPWELRHYETRLEFYYGADAASVRAVLDAVAVSDEALDVSTVQSALAATDLEQRPTRDRVLDLLYRLEADHYLSRVGGRDTFATPLLRRTWRGIRRLG